MYTVMARTAEDPRLALTHRHDFHPCWFLSSLIFLQVSSGSHLMPLDLFSGATVLTGLSQEPLSHF